MLHLRFNNNPYQLYKCSISGDLITPGDYYYIDDEDGVIVKATVYKELKQKEKEVNWDYSKINNAMNEYEYRQRVKENTRLILASSILERKLADKHYPSSENIEINKDSIINKGDS